VQIVARRLAPYRRGMSTTQHNAMPDSDTGERVTPVLDFPSRDGLTVQAVRVDYEPGGFTRGTHRHPAGAYVYVVDGSVVFGIDDGEPFVLEAGESYYEPPGALHAVSRNASDEVPASLLAFFVLGQEETATVYNHDA
jgi:quercetin dioxygenase-like cupin family protein